MPLDRDRLASRIQSLIETCTSIRTLLTASSELTQVVQPLLIGCAALKGVLISISGHVRYNEDLDTVLAPGTSLAAHFNITLRSAKTDLEGLELDIKTRKDRGADVTEDVWRTEVVQSGCELLKDLTDASKSLFNTITTDSLNNSEEPFSPADMVSNVPKPLPLNVATIKYDPSPQPIRTLPLHDGQGNSNRTFHEDASINTSNLRIAEPSSSAKIIEPGELDGGGIDDVESPTAIPTCPFPPLEIPPIPELSGTQPAAELIGDTPSHFPKAPNSDSNTSLSPSQIDRILTNESPSHRAQIRDARARTPRRSEDSDRSSNGFEVISSRTYSTQPPESIHAESESYSTSPTTSHRFILRDSSSFSAPLDRRSSITIINTNRFGEGVYVHWLKPHAELFNHSTPEDEARVTYLTIPIISDSSVKTVDIVKRWLNQKTPRSLKTPAFNKRGIVSLESIISDDRIELPAQVAIVTLETEKEVRSWVANPGECHYAVLAFAISNAKSLDHVIWRWEVLIHRMYPDIRLIILGFGPGAGAIRPGGVDRNISPAELERIATGMSVRRASSSSGSSAHAFVSFVSRASGLAASKRVGAHAYMECSAMSTGDLDRVFTMIIGNAAAARFQYLAAERDRRASVISSGTTAS